MAEPMIDPDAPMIPADHALAHALTLIALRVVADAAWTDVLRDVVRQSLATRRHVMPPAIAGLRRPARHWSRAQPSSAEGSRARRDIEVALMRFHEARLALAQSRMEDKT